MPEITNPYEQIELAAEAAQPVEGASGERLAAEMALSQQLAARVDDLERQVASAQPAPLPDDARECLLDVVSHHRDFVEACQRCADIEAANGDEEDVGYWAHQINVLNRMKEQAERALAAAPAPAGPQEGGEA